MAKKGRNAAWAEKAIRESVSITDKASLENHVIDLIADWLTDLLEKLDGRKIEKEGGTLTFMTKGARVGRLVPGLRFNILT